MDDSQTTGRLHHGQWRARHPLRWRDGKPQLRVWEHRDGVIEGFTRRYGVKRLVWFEFQPDFPSAIAREKQLKKWNRAWKLELIEGSNPGWRDLWEELL
jgi:putative endonuclease